MIKKVLLGLGIGLLSLIGFSSAGQIGYIGQLTQSTYNSSYNFMVNGQGNLLTQYFGLGKRVLQLQDGVYFFRSVNTIPYIYVSSNYTGPTGNAVQGYLNSYALCDYIGLDSGNASQPSNCQSYNIDGLSSFLGRYLEGLNNNGYYYYDYYQLNAPARQAYCGSLTVCFSNNSFDKSLCFYGGNGGFAYPCDSGDLGYPNGIYLNNTNLTNSLGLSPYFDSIDNTVIGISPGQSVSTGSTPEGILTGGGIALSSNYSAINYYEKTYGWDKSICYAGVSSLDYLYGQNGVSFHEGQGLSIFDVFSGVYGNTDLDKVYVWLNVQLFNYENWFNIPGNNIGGVGHPSWLGNYNSGTNQIDLYYDNLTFPFTNKPVAFYFLADNIESQSPYFTMGSSVVSYCNLKINGGSFEEIIDQADKNNINNYTEQSNTNQALNPDGTQKDYTGYWVGSGVELAFSGNVSIKNTLKNFFDEFDKGLSIIDINTNNRILPTWIVSAFIFVVLFKFLRKK